MRATLPLWLFLSAIALGASLIFGFSLREVIFAESEVGLVFGVLGIYLAIAVVSGYSIATVIFIGIRFYRNFYTDEGYLTFTLPVKRSTLFFSKVLSGTIFLVSTSLVVITSFVLALLMVPSSIEDSTPVLFEVLRFLWSMIEGIFESASDTATMITMLILSLLILFCLMLFEILALYFCITVGSVITKKLKVLAAIGCYYALNFAIGTISSLAQIFLMIFSGHIALVVMSLSPMQLSLVAIFLLLSVLGFMMLLTSILYYATEKLIEKKLNLP